jgi:MFS transporter, NNP family, nitrate/nitrite transporter
MLNSEITASQRRRVLWISTIAFTVLFNVWLMLGILGISIRKELQLSDAQLEWLIATAILSGSVFRLNFGLWTDRLGGRFVMTALLLVSAIPVYLFSLATSYEEMLVCAFFFGLAGNSFSVGISWNSAWFPSNSKGTALGIFGAGNVGAAGTKMLVIFLPTVLTLVPAAGILGGVIPGGWRAIPAFYSFLLIAMAVVTWRMTPSPDLRPSQGRGLQEMLRPLAETRVWRFSLYYVVVFGAYVALSAWLPKYYVDTYGIPLQMAALYTASFIFPASLLRPLGGWLSDRYGPRVVTYAVFISMLAALLLLCIPVRHSLGLGLAGFVSAMFVVGCAMGIGKASVYKYIPNYFPKDVGAVGGLVGLLGALGGFFLPPTFGFISRSTGSPQAAFIAMVVLTGASLVWLHLTVLGIRASQWSASNPTPMATAES